MFEQFRRRTPLTDLAWWDVVLLSVILFGMATVNSVQAYLSMGQTATAELPEFTSAVNWYALASQLPLLLLAFFYLWLRRFDFSRWTIKLTPKAVGLGVLFFIGVALVFDLYFMVAYTLFPQPVATAAAGQASTLHPFLAVLSSVDLSLLLYAALNGFYEEIFFLGMCVSVAPKYRTSVFIYSLFVRYIFHTYQGTISALAIGLLLGSIFYLLHTRRKDKNLVPFFVAHAIGDIIGVGLISYFI